MKILAIDPGTRTMGAALLEREKLVYHAVHAIKSGGTSHERAKEARRTVLRLIEDLKPDSLAIEKPCFSNNRNGAALHALVQDIVTLGRRKRLRVIQFAANTIKKRVCGNGWASKREVAQAMSARYPELIVYLTQDRKWKERYHQNMFDAVAVGILSRDSGMGNRSQVHRPA